MSKSSFSVLNGLVNSYVLSQLIRRSLQYCVLTTDKPLFNMEVIVIFSQTIYQESFSKPFLPNMHNNKAFKMEYLVLIEAINLVDTLQHKIRDAPILPA